jgi:maltooligosyltrehalose trehalohydrolase
VPDPQDPGTFERSKLDWDEVGEPYHRKMLNWYRGLIALRRRLPAIGQGVLAQADGDRIVFERDGVVVRVNLAVPDCAVVEIVEGA